MYQEPEMKTKYIFLISPATYYVIAFIPFWKRQNYRGQKSEQWLPGAVGKGRGVTAKGRRELFSA